MTPGNAELVEVLVWWAVAGPATRVIVVRDERRLAPEALAHAWSPASRDAAWLALWLMGFFPPYLAAFFLVHFARTRRSAWGFGLGLAWTLAVLAVGFAAEEGVATALDAWAG